MKIKIDTIKDNLPKRDIGTWELNDLQEDIKENGLINPITLNHKRELLAGRRRLTCLKNIGKKFLENGDYKIIKTRDELHDFDIFLNENLKRKDLSQLEEGRMLLDRKRIYEKMYPETRQGGDRSKLHIVRVEKRFTEDTAKKINKSERVIQERIQAAEIVEKKPELAKLVKSKKIIKALNIENQKKDIEELKPEKELKGVYDIIVVDPPWNYGREYDPETSRVASPYPEMKQSELLDLKLPFDDKGILFLWTTHQFIWDAKELLEKWGYEYKAILVWNKEKMGMGSWFRMQCEFCLLGIKGKPFWNIKDMRDIISEGRTKHSQKPEGFYNLIDLNSKKVSLKKEAILTIQEVDNYGRK